MNTTLLLIDFLKENEKKQLDIQYSELLKQHQFKRKLSIPFSGNFLNVATIGGVGESINNFHSPFDIIKIDSFLFITDKENQRIQIYDERNLFYFMINFEKYKPKKIEKSDDGVFVTFDFDNNSLLIKLNKKLLFESIFENIKEGINCTKLNLSDPLNNLIRWKLEYQTNILALKAITTTFQSEKLLIVSTKENTHLIQANDGTILREVFSEELYDLTILQVDEKVNLLASTKNTTLLIFDELVDKFEINTKLQSIIYPSSSYDSSSFSITINEGLNIRNICSRTFLKSGIVQPTKKTTKEVVAHKQIIISQSKSSTVHIFDLFLMKQTKDDSDPTFVWDYELVKTFRKKQILDSPTKCLVDENGNLYIVDSKQHIIQIFR